MKVGIITALLALSVPVVAHAQTSCTAGPGCNQALQQQFQINRQQSQQNYQRVQQDVQRLSQQPRR
jgi:hypothetical protein